MLAKAYFDGDFPALKREFVAKTGKSWDAYAKALETEPVRDGRLIFVSHISDPTGDRS